MATMEAMLTTKSRFSWWISRNIYHLDLNIKVPVQESSFEIRGVSLRPRFRASRGCNSHICSGILCRNQDLQLLEAVTAVLHWSLVSYVYSLVGCLDDCPQPSAHVERYAATENTHGIYNNTKQGEQAVVVMVRLSPTTRYAEANQTLLEPWDTTAPKCHYWPPR